MACQPCVTRDGCMVCCDSLAGRPWMTCDAWLDVRGRRVTWRDAMSCDEHVSWDDDMSLQGDMSCNDGMSYTDGMP